MPARGDRTALLQRLERGDFTECRRHYTKGRQQTPYVQDHGLCLTLTDQELFASACSGLPREGGTPMRDGCQTYLATLGRPLGCQKAWELRGVAVFRKLDWRLESEALKRSLLEYALIFYKHWTEMKLDKHSQLRIVHHLLDQVSRQLHFVQGKDVASPTSSQKKKDEVASLDFEMREPRPFTPAAGPIELRLKILIIKSNWCFAAAVHPAVAEVQRPSAVWPAMLVGCHGSQLVWSLQQQQQQQQHAGGRAVAVPAPVASAACFP